ncbi:hypothetical protein IAR55_006925 [Kwoniella newhampshirensis]|uniref:UBC core domain-containing protein n=1 Tax=Kwoniella newhampshirensis TaxID=1651941 RepID=A0AAW0YTQ7_9TREE
MPPVPDSLPGLPDDYTSQFFTNDVVTRPDDLEFLARVLRCWADEEGPPPPIAPGEVMHPLDRSLKRGEVGISNIANGELEIVPESTLRLYQREFIKGDVVKRALTSPESALVVDIRSAVRLQHCLSKEKVDGWVDFEKMGNALLFDARDRVVYDEWIGTVEEVFEDGLVESQIGICYRLAEMGGLLEPGRLVADVIPKDMPEAAMSNPLPPFANPAVDRVIEVNPVVVYVTWNAINQQLPTAEQEKHPEPKQFWYGEDIKKLTRFDGIRMQPPGIGSILRFKDPADETRYGVKPTVHAGGMKTVKAMKVVESRSKLTLRWQSGEETEEWAIDMVPYRNVDDYETWPGEHLIWRGDNGERRHAVAQMFDPHQRVAELLFMDNNEKQIVPALEIDPGGRTNDSTYGVGIGMQVLLCENNGSTPPAVPVLGQAELPVKNMWSRNELAKLAEEYVVDSSKFGYFTPEGDRDLVDWYGEVIRLNLNGSIDVQLPNNALRTVGLHNTFLLNESHPEDLFAELEQQQPGEGDDWEMQGQLEAGIQNGFEVGSDASWETMSAGEDRLAAGWDQPGVIEIDVDMTSGEVEEDEESRDAREVDLAVGAAQTVTSQDRVPTPTSPGENPVGEEDEETRVTTKMYLANGVAQLPAASFPAPSPTSPGGSSKAGPSTQSNGQSVQLRSARQMDDGANEDEPWQRFEMLEAAPEDHWFIREPRLNAANKTYHSRLQREHKALISSLPDNILVRSYEDRTDLMRVLIVGPEGTPYSNAPFVFDVYLNPTKFPQEPPTVHFHSHTNGHGRCNPNLYEDGKVCLSILGTWSGDKSESWIPSKSSLLQVFVSISGLVLVRSPYHCEPAFAKLEGTREGIINSRLYSEKAYVLSRSFVRTALERPPLGLEAELRYFYLTQGRLQVVIEHAKRLIEKGEGTVPETLVEENAEMWNADAVGSLTTGAIITLKVSEPARPTPRLGADRTAVLRGRYVH